MERRRILLVAAAVVAAVGLALVVVYARGADVRAAERFETVETLKAAEPIAFGETFDEAREAGKIVRAEVPRGELLEGAVNDPDELGGLIATMAVAPGEQLTTAKFAEEAVTGARLPLPDDMFAGSVQLTDSQRVAGFVNPGDQVAVLAVLPPPPGTVATSPDEEPLAQVLIPDATVLGVGSTSPVRQTSADGEGAEAEGSDRVSNTVLTLALTEAADTLRLAYATENGTLTFVLRGPDVEIARGDILTADDLLDAGRR